MKNRTTLVVLFLLTILTVFLFTWSAPETRFFAFWFGVVSGLGCFLATKKRAVAIVDKTLLGSLFARQRLEVRFEDRPALQMIITLLCVAPVLVVCEAVSGSAVYDFNGVACAMATVFTGWLVEALSGSAYYFLFMHGELAAQPFSPSS
ncbi:MAG: hypothetical protein AAB495_03570 [Patescibacteria group bacterium]|mgnify:CR=1 FL=1